MSLVEDLGEIPATKICLETIQENLVRALRNARDVDDAPEDAAKKLIILGSAFRMIKEYCREGLKAVQAGQEYAAIQLDQLVVHKTLDQFTQVSITGPDGIEHEIDPKTALQNLDRAEKMIREGGA